MKATEIGEERDEGRRSEMLKGNERRRALARHFAVRGPIITSALKLASPDRRRPRRRGRGIGVRGEVSSTFNRIFLPSLADN